MHSIKKPMKIIFSFFLVVVLIVLAYVAYVLIDYYRIEDKLSLEVSGTGASGSTVPIDEELEITSWNIGFGAYTDEYSFFMDGGKYSRGFSEEIVTDTVKEIGSELAAFNSDFTLLQEVDIDSTRSYHINEKDMLSSALEDRASTFALNFDSPYLFYPILEPHGKSVAGLFTLSNYNITSGLRRSLPIQDDLAKLVDCDRCYTVNRMATAKGNELVIYNLHLSAYTTDPTIANKQLQMLYNDITAEYSAGNYIICGGDFNKDLLGNSSQVFGVSGEDFSWAKSFPFDTVPEGFSLVAPFNLATPVPSCRNADRPWDPKTNFQITIDGFIISDNVSCIASDVVDLQFAYSDHNPVWMNFKLK